MTAEASAARSVIDKEPSGITLVSVHPQTLISGDIAYSIIDPSRTMVGGSFLPEYYKQARSEVLRVQDPLTGKVRLRTKDGHHRVAEAAKYMTNHPDYDFKVHDVTGITLRINYPGQKEDCLSEQQFYAEIGEATKAHGEIEFRRMAGHIFSDWRGWVGDEVADTFPALAALQTLSRDAYQMRTLNEDIIHQSIDSSEMAVMGGEDGEIRGVLKEGLKAMASRIIVTGLGYDEIAFAGFELATRAYEDIGDEARSREIRGLLALRDIYNRFTPIRKSSDKHEQERSQLEELLRGAFYSIRAPGDKEADHRREEVRAIINALSNTDCSYGDLARILDISQGGSISERYKQIKVSKQLQAKREKGVSASRVGIKSRSGESDANNVVLATADDLGKALTKFSGDPSRLSAEARSAVTRVLRQAKRLGIVEDDMRVKTHGNNGRVLLGGHASRRESDVSQGGTVPEGYVWDSTRGQFVRKDMVKILPVLDLIAGNIKKIRADGGHVPSYISDHPKEVFVRDWQQYAACKDNPDAMDVEGAEQNNAVVICRACPVKHACLADELERGIEVIEKPLATDATTNEADAISDPAVIDVGDILEENQIYVRGGMVARDRRALLRNSPQEAKEIVRSVKEARAFQTPILGRYLK